MDFIIENFRWMVCDTVPLSYDSEIPEMRLSYHPGRCYRLGSLHLCFVNSLLLKKLNPSSSQR